MSRKSFIILAAVPVCLLLLIFFALRHSEAPPKKEPMPEWAALWEARRAKPVDEAADIIFSKNFPVAVEKEYPIGTSSEKIFSDCKSLDYKLIPKKRFPSSSLTKEYPCRFSSCSAVHSLGGSGYSISVSWCEENGKITWIRSRFGTWVD